jgi:TRAP-type C4-dicarboxylate transport system substrate-binding protein
MNKMKLAVQKYAACIALALPGLLPLTAAAQDLPKTHLRVIGSISNLPQYTEFEVPFWTKQLGERSKGAITAEVKGFNEMGLKGPEVLRLMGQGVVEIGATVIAYLAADDPANEMIDMAGLLPDVKTAREVTEAARPVLEKLYREKFGVELLGIGTYPAQVLYCNGELKSLADVKGRKVRAAGRSQSELVAALAARRSPWPSARSFRRCRTRRSIARSPAPSPATPPTGTRSPPTSTAPRSAGARSPTLRTRRPGPPSTPRCGRS